MAENLEQIHLVFVYMAELFEEIHLVYVNMAEKLEEIHLVDLYMANLKRFTCCRVVEIEPQLLRVPCFPSHEVEDDVQGHLV